jgi:hypothetical protein
MCGVAVGAGRVSLRTESAAMVGMAALAGTHILGPSAMRLVTRHASIVAGNSCSPWRDLRRCRHQLRARGCAANGTILLERADMTRAACLTSSLLRRMRSVARGASGSVHRERRARFDP